MSHREAQYPNNIVKGKGKRGDHMTGDKECRSRRAKEKRTTGTPWNKGKGKTGKGVYQSYGLWDMEKGQQEDVTGHGWPLEAPTLCNLNEDFS